MNIINQITTYLKGCPLLSGGRINANYLGPEEGRYAVDNVPGTPVVKQYADGGSLRQFLFVFATRRAYSADVLDNLKNSGFFEDFSGWLEQKTRAGELPSLGEGRQPVAVEALTCGYLYQEGSSWARYQIQCRLLYYQKEGV